MLMTDSQKEKYDLFTNELAALLTKLKGKKIEIKYYIADWSGKEYVEVFDAQGKCIMNATEITGLIPGLAVYNIIGKMMV